jgi:predicted ATPase/DNA-binding CsgD family transcriptional regulator
MRMEAATEGLRTLDNQPGHTPNGTRESRAPTREQVGHLPVELSSFVGREDAVAECCALLGNKRLVTLCGPGGIGKSRLGLQVARCSAEAFRDGMFLVELASVEDSALVPRVVAGALGLAERAGEELTDLLVVALRSQQILLIMDDCDRHVEACAALAIRLLDDVPGLTILATSRERLDIRGEVVWRVPSLRTPAPDAGFDEIASSDAVQLFVARAQEVAPWFRLDPGNAQRAAQLCRRLDGIPLAIELAAARMQALNLDQLSSRLEGNVELMMRGSRTAPTRQQTLRAAIDWSYQLLNELERALFRRLSVFSGGFFVDAAEIVTQGQPLGTGDTLPVLERLIDKSLVVSEARDGLVRQRMLESLREYAHARLVESGEEDQVRRRHFDWILNGVESTDPDRMTSAGVAERTLELDNLRAALTWAADRSEGELALRLAVASACIWEYKGQFAEGIHWLKRALELPRAGNVRSTRVRAFKWIGVLNYGLGDMRAARSAVCKACELIAGDPNPDQPPLCVGVLGNIERASGNLDKALRLYRIALESYKACGLRFWEQATLFAMGSVLFEQGDYTASRTACERCLALGGDLAWATARAQVILAYLANLKGDRVEDERLAEDALMQFRAQGDPSGVGIALRALAQFALEQGRHARAWACLGEALDIALAQGDRMALARTLETVACMLANCAPGEAVQIGGAAASLRERTGTQPWPTERARLDRWLASAQAKLSNRTYADSWRFGTGLSDAEAASAARRFVARAVASHQANKSTQVTAEPLTARQLEVAVLVALGLTNQQIGVELVVSPATARAHVEHILARLGLHGRAQLAAWAVAHGFATANGSASGSEQR